MMLKLLKLTLPPLLLFALFSCSGEPICRKSKEVEVGVTFYVDSINPLTGRRAEQQVKIEPVTVKGVGVDSILIDAGSISSLNLPLHQQDESCKFMIQIGEISDTLTFYYKNNTELLSFECGAIHTHTLDSVKATKHLIDSLAVEDTKVTTTHVENIKIYFFR